MHILVDLQALQTRNSRHRGIGRYSLSLFRAMVEAGPDVEFSVLLNAAFAAEVDEATRLIEDLVPRDRIHVFDSLGRTCGMHAENAARARAAARLMDLEVTRIDADFVHVASMFEGLDDDAVTGTVNDRGWTTTLYDLIPWYHKKTYLSDPSVRQWYMSKLDCARRAELLFAISASARGEAIETLGRDARSVVNIGSDVDPFFSKAAVLADRRQALLGRLGLPGPFVLYTAGIDYRKNIEGLITAYASLSTDLRRTHQLAIVCKVTLDDRQRLAKLGRTLGLEERELVLTGFVTDAELADLYRLCELFVFPSFHEGFGMPILEAMRCGAPVIGSNCSSMPEILGIADAQFDPHRPESIAARMAQALQDPAFRAALRSNGAAQETKFSWNETATRALDAFRAQYDERRRTIAVSRRIDGRERPSLAFISPLPPEQSGIADYSSELIPALSKHYDLTLVSDLSRVDHIWLDGIYPVCSIGHFKKIAHRFDRVLYQIGNSAFHAEALALMQAFGGTVVLHDFYLSNLFEHLDASARSSGILSKELLRSHGYAPLVKLNGHDTAASADVRASITREYPCSRLVFDCGYGTIVHSSFSLNAARSHYGIDGADSIARIAHLRGVADGLSREDARALLQVATQEVIVCAFGLIGRTKLNRELVRAWCTSDLIRRVDTKLVFLGPADPSPYLSELKALIASFNAQERVVIKGYVADDTFRQWLAAADCAVQLRTDSRGETSGTVLHCLASRLPVVVNRHGTLTELPSNAVLHIPDRFSDDELATAIKRLLDEPDERRERVAAGIAYIREHGNATRIARRYFDVIEHFYEKNPNRMLDRFIADCMGNHGVGLTPSDLDSIASIADGQLPQSSSCRCLIDIDAIAMDPERTLTMSGAAAFLRQLILSTEERGMRCEPVVWDAGVYRRACSQTSELLGLGALHTDDDVVDIRRGDVFVVLVQAGRRFEETTPWMRRHRALGLHVCCVLLLGDGKLADSTTPIAELQALLPWVDSLLTDSPSLCETAGQMLDRDRWSRDVPLSMHLVDRPRDDDGESEKPSGSWSIAWADVLRSLSDPDTASATRRRPVWSSVNRSASPFDVGADTNESHPTMATG